VPPNDLGKGFFIARRDEAREQVAIRHLGRAKNDSQDLPG
jgi:hypothetical protein